MTKENLEGARFEAESTSGMRSKALGGGRWMMIESVGIQVMSFIVTAILARWFLDEADYGAIAAVTVSTGLLGMLGNFSFSVSLIQRDDVSRDRVSSVFWAGLIVGTVWGTAFILFSGPIARSLGQPEVRPLIILASTQIVTAILSSIPEAVLLRKLQFKKAAAVSLASFAVYPPLAIGLAALFDAGPWAVIIGQAARPLVKTVLGMVAARWKPSLVFGWNYIKEDFALNGGFFLVTLTAFLTKNLDYWLVSRYLGPTLLGIYYMAFLIPTLLRQRLNWAVGRVLVPVLSRVREDPERFRRAFVDASRLIALIALPALVGLALIARPSLEVLIGARWLDAAGPLPFLAVAAAADALSQVTLRALVADGRPLRALWFNVPRVIVLTVGLLVAVRADDALVAVGWAVLIAALVNLALAHLMAVVNLNIPARYLARCYQPVVLPIVAMIVATRAVAVWLESIDGLAIVTLVAAVLTGAIAYLGTGFVTSRQAFGRLVVDGKSFIGLGAK